MTAEVDESLQKLRQALNSGNIQSIAKAAFSCPSLKDQLVEGVVKILDDECSTLCRNSGEFVSLFHRVPIDNVEALSWKQAVSELQRKSPILFRLIQTIVGRSDHRNLHKRGESHYPGMCMATAILLKERNTRMCGIQSFLSLVLFNCRVNKKVCTCTCTCMMCVHYVFSDTGIIIISQRGIGNGSYLAALGQGLIEATKCMYDCNVSKI